jgi:hypothetical protein
VTTNDDIEASHWRRLHELSGDPAVRDLALAMLPEPECERLLAAEDAEVALPPERLRAIYSAALRRARLERAFAAAQRAGSRVLEAADELAATVGRWFGEALRARRPSPSFFGASTQSTVKVIVDDLDGQEIEFEGMHTTPPRWLGGRTLAVEVQVDIALAKYPGWEQAETLLRLRAGDGGPDVVLKQPAEAAGNMPIRAARTATHCVLAYEFTFCKRGGAAESKQPVPPDAIREIRLLPVPV